MVSSNDARPLASRPHSADAKIDAAPGTASFLWEQAGWDLATTADDRPILYRRSEAELTAWMRNHLYLTWVSDPRPWDQEAGVIASLLPPLNSDMNSRHPLHSLVVARREAWAAAASASFLPS